MSEKCPSTSNGDAGGPRIRDWVSIYLKGVFMGAADTVPGVSGGTIALITGIYERLVKALAAIDIDFVLDTLGIGRERRINAIDAAARVDFAFLFILGLGIATAILTVSRVVVIGLAEFRAPTNAFFFGLIAASAVVLYGEVTLNTPRRWLAAVVAALVAFILTGATAAGEVPHGPIAVLLTGAVTSSAMLLPGISGAALLYILGQYEFMIAALHGFVGALGGIAGGGDPGPVFVHGFIVAIFLIGVAFGLLTVAHAVRWALRRDRGTTLTVLVSLMVGALRLPVEEVLANTARWTPTVTLGLVLAAGVGGALVLILDRYTDDLDYDI